MAELGNMVIMLKCPLCQVEVEITAKPAQTQVVDGAIVYDYDDYRMRDHVQHRCPKVDSRDPQRRYCGMKKDGTLAKSSPDKVGYCGPHCMHCLPNPDYELQHDVWVCAADFDREEP